MSHVGEVWAHKRDEHRIYLMLYELPKTHSKSPQYYQALNLYTGELRMFCPDARQNSSEPDRFTRIA